MILAAGVPRNIAIVIAVVVTVGWLLYIVANLRRARPEIGSEIELAPNRKPYYSDEELEGKRLERTQLAGVAMLVVLGVGLPLYWVHEPSRQDGAIEEFDKQFVGWGARDFAATADGGFNCAGCHGGMKGVGGVAAYTITDQRTGEVRPVAWKAPAINTVVYRFSDSEIKFILVYGRPFSPMSPWGVEGGGPMNDQQINDLISYLHSIAIPRGKDQVAGEIPKTINDNVAKALADAMASGKYKSEGEALFNLEVGSGGYSCARCHTKGWSYSDPQQAGGGALGPNLTGGSTVRQFPAKSDQIDFITKGSELGKRYGQQGQGSGRMPGFGQLLTPEQINAIVDYERGL